MTRGQTVRYLPVTEQMRAPGIPLYLSLLSPQSTSGVGVEAGEVALLMERLTASLNTSETWSHALLSRRPEEVGPIEYRHVSTKPIGTVKVRYRNVGRVLPREVPAEDE